MSQKPTQEITIKALSGDLSLEKIKELLYKNNIITSSVQIKNLTLKNAVEDWHSRNSQETQSFTRDPSRMTQEDLDKINHTI